MASLALPTLTVVRGTNFEIPLAFQTPEGGPLSLVGCVVYITAKAKTDDDVTDSAAVFKKDVSVHTNAAGGLTSVLAEPADTDASRPGDYFYDIEVKDGAGRVTSFGTGKFTLKGEMTRRV